MKKQTTAEPAKPQAAPEPKSRLMRSKIMILLPAVIMLAALFLWPPSAILFGLLFAIYYSVRYLRSLPAKGGSLRKRTWQWLKEVFDSLSGIG